MPLDLSDEALGLPKSKGLDLSDKALGLPEAPKTRAQFPDVPRTIASPFAPEIAAVAEQFGAGLYGLATTAYAGVKGLFKGAIGATAGLPFGEVFREEFNKSAESAADAYVPLTPGGEALTHKMSELITAGTHGAGGLVFEKGLPVPFPFSALRLGAGEPLVAAGTETLATLAALAAPFGRRAAKAPAAKAPTWEEFAAKYPEAAKSVDASSLGTVRYRREDTSILDAVTRQMDTELGLSGETAKEMPFRAKAAMVFNKVAPDVPLGEKLRAVQALEKKLNILDAARLDLSQRRGLPAPTTRPFEEPITVSEKGVALTADQARALAEEVKSKSVSEAADALGFSAMGQLQRQAQSVLRHAEGTPERTIEMSALKQMWRSAFPDEHFRFTTRNAALEKFLNFGGKLTYAEALEAMGPLKKKEARIFRKYEAGAIDIEGMEYLLNSFKDLPDQPVLKRSTIVGQLNRQGVPQAEKDVVLRALRDRDTITQAELVGSVAADILPLKVREINLRELPETLADLQIGLDRVGGLQLKGGTVDTARVWQMPFRHELRNHFDDPQYFAHTRGFDRNSVRHIAELQSDLTANLPKPGETLVRDRGLDIEYEISRESLAAIEKARPLEKRQYERILMEENRQASKDGMRVMRVATADTLAKVQSWILGPGEKLPPNLQGIYNFYKNEVSAFTRSRFGAKEVVDEFGHTWMEWPVRPEAAHEKIPAFGGRQPSPGVKTRLEEDKYLDAFLSSEGPRGRQRGAIDIPEWEDVQRARERGITAAEQATERAWTTPTPADDALYTKTQKAFEASRAAEEAGRKVTMASILRRAQEEVIAHDYHLRAELERAGPYGQKAVDWIALQNGATMAAKSRMGAVNDNIFNDLDTITKTQVDELMRLRRIIEIDSYKGVGKHKHAEGITGPQAEAVAIRMKRELGDEQFARVYDVTNRIMKEYKDILGRRFEAGLLSEESYLKLLHFDYSPTEFINLIDPLQTFTVHGRLITVRTSGVPFLERGKRGEVVMDSQLLLAEALVRSENLISKNDTMRQLHELATKAPENGIVSLPAKNTVGKAGTPDAYMKHTPKGQVALGVRSQGRQDFVLMREDLAEQFIRRPQVMPEIVGTIARFASGSAAIKATATTYNPAFIIAGLPMDILHTWLATSRVYSPHLPKFAGQMAADLAATVKDAWTKGPEYQQALREGLGSAFMTHEGRGFTGLTERSVSVVEKQMMPRFDKLKGAISYANESADIWVRMAHRHRLISQGMDSKQATGQARNRLDYSAGGQVTRAVDTVIPYTNVAVQALAKVVRAGAKDPADLATKLAWAGGVISAWTLANMISSPETWKQIPTSTKLRWLPITFGDQWYVIDPDGNKRYVYMNGVRLDAVVEPLAATIVSGLELAEYGRPPDDVLVQSAASLNPVFNFAAPPTIEAIKTYLSNYDAYTGRRITPHFGQVKSEHEGTTFGRGEPPSLLARQIGGATGTSPPRLDAAARKVLNTNNLYLSLMGWGYKELFEGNDPRTQAAATEQMLLQNPAIRPLVRLTNPSSQYLRDIQDRREEEGSRRKQMTDSVDDLLFQVRKGQASLNDVKVYVKNQPREDREWLANYATTTRNVKEIMRRFGASEGVPNEAWWRAVSTLEPRPRAQEFHSQWLVAAPEDRRRMERIAVALHNKGAGFYSDSFRRELARERALLGTEQR